MNDDDEDIQRLINYAIRRAEGCPECHGRGWVRGPNSSKPSCENCDGNGMTYPWTILDDLGYEPADCGRGCIDTCKGHTDTHPGGK